MNQFKNKIYILFLFVLILNGFLTAQTKLYEIKGKILDLDDHIPLEFASIYIAETAYFTESDSYGTFKIEVPESDRLVLKCNRLGYQVKEIVLKWKDLESNIQLTIYLQKIINKEVEIRDRRTDQSINIKEKASSFELLPTVSGNLESVLPSIALGVRSSAGGELSSQYSVRGGSYDENLVFVNDFEVFRPQLIRNGQQEGLSFPNPDLIKELNFSSGGFESKYGDKQSSVLDIKYKIPDSIRGSAVLSALGASAHLEGSMQFNKSSSSKFRYLIGARYKTTKYLLGSLDVEGEYQPNFLDIQSYLSYDFSRTLKLAVIGNLNKSIYQLIPESASVAKGSFFQVINLNTAFEGSEKDIFEQNMAGLSLTYVPQNTKTPYFIKFLSSLYSGFEAEQFDILGYYRLVEVEAGNTDESGKEVKLWGEGTQHTYSRNFLTSTVHHQELRGGIDLPSKNHPVSHFIQWGLFFRQEFFKDKINEWERLDSAGFALPYREDALVLNYVYKSVNDFQNEKVAIWLQDEMQWLGSGKHLIKWTPGLRMHHAALNGEWIFNPRLKIEWIPIRDPHNTRCYVSGGLYHQVPFYREFRALDGSLNLDVKSQKSMHLVAGIQKDFFMRKISPSKFKWVSEFYYKKLWDMVSYELDNVRIRYSANNDSEGYAIGWDNRINGEFVPGVESWVNLSFLRTREKINGVQHKERDIQNPEGQAVADVPRPTDQFFALGLFFQDYLPGNENIKMHLNINIASGLPYGLKGDNLVYRNEKRFKAYHRADIGFSFLMWNRKNLPRHPNHLLRFTRQAWLSLEVFNLLKVKNEASISWIKSLYNYQFAIPNYLSSRRINLKLRFDF
ncbi:MAG: carboxypeptidase-like regulatory domain-containing protein [Saprospiraceae bacterium]